MILDYANFSPEHTRKLNEMAKRIRMPYTEFVDICCKRYGKNYLFWATPLASRNIYNDSDTFLSVCRVLLTIELLKEENYDEIITIYQSEKKILLSIVDRDISISSHEDGISLSKTNGMIRRWLSFFHFGKQEVLFRCCTRYKSKKRSIIAHSLLFIPTLSSYFNGNEFIDRYFTGIIEYQDICVLPDCLLNTNISTRDFLYRIDNCTNYRFLNPYWFFRISDLFDIIKYWLYVNKVMHDSFVYEGMDFSPIFRRCLNEGKTNNTSFKGLQIRKILKRMSMEKITVKNFVAWYEGRPNDVMAVSAFRQFFPSANCVGYEGQPIPECNPSQAISKYQYLSSHSPKKMAIPGEKYESLAHQFCQDIPLIYVPILRAQYALQMQKKTSDKSKKTILVLLPYYYDGAKSLLEGINAFMSSQTVDCLIMIKNHPVMDGYTAKDYGIDQLVFSPEYVHGTLLECLEGVDLVVTSLTSSTLEVVFRGIPVVIICPQGNLVYSALPMELENLYCHMVYGISELTDALHECLQRATADPVLLKDVLVPKSRETIIQMFQD